MTQDAKKALSFHKQKQKLRMIHKRLRAGLVGWEELDEETKALLVKYYGY